MAKAAGRAGAKTRAKVPPALVERAEALKAGAREREAAMMMALRGEFQVAPVEAFPVKAK